MNITPIDRRDLQRLLKGIIHGEKREDVKVEVKYYVQFWHDHGPSEDDDIMSVQTFIDPYSGFDRPQARALVRQAIAKLDAEAAISGKIVVAPCHVEMKAETGIYTAEEINAPAEVSKHE